MLVNPKQMILEAQKKGYAIGCFNTSDLEITKAIVAAAEKQKSPVIVSTTPKAIDYAGHEALSAVVKEIADKSKMPVALHLDHGLSIQLVEDCLKLGYTSVMFDGSGSSLEHNEILTRQAADLAHKYGVPCEGELGHIGKAGAARNKLTNPSDIIGFIQHANIDFLAVSIGSVHGSKGEGSEKLDIELLKKIREKTHTPLVLHGSSGVSKTDIRAAIKNGITKINVDTDIRHEFVNEMKSVLSKDEDIEDPRQVLGKVMEALQKLIEEKIELFGSKNVI